MFLVKPCASSPCKNGGTCYGIEDKFMCECAEGFDGDTCEDKGTIKGNDYNINVNQTVIFLWHYTEQFAPNWATINFVDMWKG